MMREVVRASFCRRGHHEPIHTTLFKYLSSRFSAPLTVLLAFLSGVWHYNAVCAASQTTDLDLEENKGIKKLGFALTGWLSFLQVTMGSDFSLLDYGMVEAMHLKPHMGSRLWFYSLYPDEFSKEISQNAPRAAATAPLWTFHLPGDHRPFGYLIADTGARMPWTPEFQLDAAARTIRLVVPTTGSSSSSMADGAAAAVADRLLAAAQRADTFPRLSDWPGASSAPCWGAPFALGLARALSPYLGHRVGGHAADGLCARCRQGPVPGQCWTARRVGA
jgi:hypothetical protein